MLRVNDVGHHGRLPVHDDDRDDNVETDCVAMIIYIKNKEMLQK